MGGLSAAVAGARDGMPWCQAASKLILSGRVGSVHMDGSTLVGLANFFHFICVELNIIVRHYT